MTSPSLDLSHATMKRLTTRNNVFVGKVETNADETDVLMERSKAMCDKMARLRLLMKLQDMYKTEQRLVYQDLIHRLLGSSFRRQLGTAPHRRW